MRARLYGGHFRMLNETLYTCRFTFYIPHFYLIVLGCLNAIVSGLNITILDNSWMKDLYFKIR
jgi:hypothetical protein